MQFIVPQFINIESKIIGPITPKQFIILIITIGLIFICYKLADFVLFIIEGVIILGLGVVIAFVRVNQQPIYYLFLNMGQGLKRPSLRIWRKEFIPVVEEKSEKAGKTEEKIISRQPLSSSRLSQIALTVDTGGEYKEE